MNFVGEGRHWRKDSWDELEEIEGRGNDVILFRLKTNLTKTKIVKLLSVNLNILEGIYIL